MRACAPSDSLFAFSTGKVIHVLDVECTSFGNFFAENLGLYIQTTAQVISALAIGKQGLRIMPLPLPASELNYMHTGWHAVRVCGSSTRWSTCVIHALCSLPLNPCSILLLMAIDPGCPGVRPW